MWSRSRKSLGTESESGSAVVEFMSVAVLLVALTIGIIQLALVLHIRNTLQDAAIEGAHRAALVGETPAGAQQLVDGLVTTALGAGFDADVSVSVETQHRTRVAVVDIVTPLPVLGLWGLASSLTVRGTAPLEYLGGAR